MTPAHRPRAMRFRRLALSACAFAVVAAAGAQKRALPVPTAAHDDGPHVFQAQDGLQAAWVCDGKVLRERVSHERPIAPRCGYPHPLLLPAAFDRALSRAPASRRVVAVSDIHGQYALLVRLLRAHGVIDAGDNWQLGRDQLVVAGDVFDRGDGVASSLWLLLRLQQQAEHAGGAVHFLLGNHETMVLAGDLRYVHPGSLQVARLLRRSYSGLYAEDTVLGRWLRTRPVMLQVGDTLFMHGGIAPDNMDLARDADATNQRYRASLGLPKAQVREQPAIARLFDGKQSPVWYRGYFDGTLGPAEVAAIADGLGVARIVVGHTTQPHVTSLHGGRVIAIDGGLKGGESGELLFIEGNRLSRGLLDGSRQPLPAYPGAPPDKD